MWWPFGYDDTRLMLKVDMVQASLDRIEGALTKQGKDLKAMAGEMDALTAQVTQNTDTEASAVQLLTNLHDLLVAAGTDPAKLDALRQTLANSKDALAAAIVANTPAA